MARTRKAGRSVTLDNKIAAAQEKLVRAKARFEKAKRNLEALMERREEVRRKELLEPGFPATPNEIYCGGKTSMAS